jgi:cytidylate kinase
MFRLIQIAIDGPAASGKSTVARRVAELLNAAYVNTGDMYRAITWLTLKTGVNPESDPTAVAALLQNTRLEHTLNNEGRPVLLLNGAEVEQSDIRQPAVAGIVSYVARIPAVRHWLVARQRAARKLGLLVMEGRDIGTVVFPSAKFKFYLTASPEVRAKRRLGQPDEVTDNADVESVAKEITGRDAIDRTRPVSPLRPAPDAKYIDSSTMTIEEVGRKIVAWIESETRCVNTSENASHENIKK